MDDLRCRWAPLEAMRLHNGAACALLLWLGRGAPTTGPLRETAAAAAVLLLCGAAHLANDLIDRPADRHNRPDRPLPGGRLRAPRLRRWLAASWSAGLGLGILALPAWTGWWILWALGGPGYSLLAKGRGWRAPVWTAAVITSCWAAGTVERGFGGAEAAATGLLLSYLTLRELIKGGEDRRGDLLAGYRPPSAAGFGPEWLLAALLLTAVSGLIAAAPGRGPRLVAAGFTLCLLGGLWRHWRPTTQAPHRAGTLLKAGAFAGLPLLWLFSAG